jgi:hypothetical protein
MTMKIVVVRCVDRKPQKDGSYNISVDGVMTFLPIFMNFADGEWCWNDLDGFARMQGHDAVY